MVAYMDSLEASGYKKTTKITQNNLEIALKSIATNRAKYNHYKAKDDTVSSIHG